MSKASLVDDTSDCQHWQLPDLGRPPGLAGNASQDAQGDTENTKECSYQDGFEQGHRDGVQAGRQEIAEQAQYLQRLMHVLAQPLEELDQAVEEGLLSLTFSLLRRLVHAEIQTSPQQIISVVNEAITILPDFSRDVRIYLHPDDAQLLQELSVNSDSAIAGCKIIEDVSLQRGGCIVKTKASRIDATVEARLDNVIDSLLQIESSEEEET